VDETIIIIPPNFESSAWTIWWGRYEYVNCTTLDREAHRVEQKAKFEIEEPMIFSSIKPHKKLPSQIPHSSAKGPPHFRRRCPLVKKMPITSHFSEQVIELSTFRELVVFFFIAYFTHLQSWKLQAKVYGWNGAKLKQDFWGTTRIVVSNTSADRKIGLTRKRKSKTDAKYWTTSFRQRVVMSKRHYGPHCTRR